MPYRQVSVALILLGSLPAGAAPAPASFPPAFQGVWNGNVETGETCRARNFEERTSDALMQITARQMNFWESACDITSLTRKDDVITVKSTCHGEGDTWQDTRVMKIQKIAGKTYLLMFSSGYITALVKCGP
jgi:hypothetical protein